MVRNKIHPPRRTYLRPSQTVRIDFATSPYEPLWSAGSATWGAEITRQPACPNQPLMTFRETHMACWKCQTASLHQNALLLYQGAGGRSFGMDPNDMFPTIYIRIMQKSNPSRQRYISHPPRLYPERTIFSVAFRNPTRNANDASPIIHGDLGSFSSEGFISIISMFFSRNFSIFQIFLMVLFPKYTREI